MKIATGCKFVCAIMAAAFCFSTLASCSLFEWREQDSFRPEEVSCNIRSIPEAREEIQRIKNNPGGDLYFMAHKEELLTDLRKLADQGDPEAMLIFGDLRREALEVGLISGKNGSFVKRPFPDDTKNDIIIGTTYIYLSANFESQKRKDAQELFRKIEDGGFDLTTPPDWIAEAKSNVEHWKMHCSQTTIERTVN